MKNRSCHCWTLDITSFVILLVIVRAVVSAALIPSTLRKKTRMDAMKPTKEINSLQLKGLIEMEMNWIPLSERLPKVGEPILVTLVTPDGQRECCVSEWIGYKWWDVSRFEVVAWMPLPEPYKPNEKMEESQ